MPMAKEILSLHHLYCLLWRHELRSSYCGHALLKSPCSSSNSKLYACAVWRHCMNIRDWCKLTADCSKRSVLLITTGHIAADLPCSQADPATQHATTHQAPCGGRSIRPSNCMSVYALLLSDCWRVSAVACLLPRLHSHLGRSQGQRPAETARVCDLHVRYATCSRWSLQWSVINCAYHLDLHQLGDNSAVPEQHVSSECIQPVVLLLQQYTDEAVTLFHRIIQLTLICTEWTKNLDSI